MQRGRESLIRTLDRYLPQLESNLLAGIVLGQRTRLPAEVKDDFAATGTTHILASSGMNVGIVAAMFFWLARIVRIRRSRAVIPVIIAMLIYSLLAGAKPSVIRADVMASAMLIGLLLNREPDLPSSIALAALALLVWNPYSLVDPGFQLSFAAVIALTAGMPLFEPHLRASLGPEGGGRPLLPRLRSAIAGGFLVSLVAQLATLPLTAQHFNQISLTGLIANALIVCVIPLLLFGGLALWLVGVLMPPAASILSWLLSIPLAYVLGVAEFFGSFPFAVVSVVSPGWSLVAVFYLIGAVVVVRLRARAAMEEQA
jgi:competence protein ComEC